MLPVKGRVGQNLVTVAHENGVDLEGACECSLACSTCHVILTSGIYDSLAPATDEEEDLLDLAFGLTSTYAAAAVAAFGGKQRSQRFTHARPPTPSH